MPRTRSILVAAVMSLLVASVLAAWIEVSERGRPVAFDIELAKSTSTPSSAKKNLPVTGSVSGLHPGGTLTLPLEVRNDNSFDIDLTSLRARVTGAPAGCPARYLTIASHDGHRVIGARSSAIQTLAIAMTADAPNTCKNVRFDLEYSGTAVKA